MVKGVSRTSRNCSFKINILSSSCLYRHMLSYIGIAVARINISLTEAVATAFRLRLKYRHIDERKRKLSWLEIEKWKSIDIIIFFELIISQLAHFHFENHGISRLKLISLNRFSHSYYILISIQKNMKIHLSNPIAFEWQPIATPSSNTQVMKRDFAKWKNIMVNRRRIKNAIEDLNKESIPKYGT